MCANTHPYIHKYPFPHSSCIIKHLDLFVRSTRHPGIRAWELPGIHPAPNDRKNAGEFAGREQE